MNTSKNTPLPIGFAVLGLLTAALLVSAILRIAAFKRKNTAPKITAAEEDLYPWATDAMKAAYPDAQAKTAQTSAAQRETVTRGDLENIVTQESQLRQGGQQAYDQMSDNNQKLISDYETGQDFRREMSKMP